MREEVSPRSSVQSIEADVASREEQYQEITKPSVSLLPLILHHGVGPSPLLQLLPDFTSSQSAAILPNVNHISGRR